MSERELLRGALARIIWIREEADPEVREQVLADLEDDLVAALSRVKAT